MNQVYLEMGDLNAELLGRGFAWLDAGKHDSLNQASLFVETVEKRQGFKISCLEEIALNNKWIDKKDLKKLPYLNYSNSYINYLKYFIKWESSILQIVLKLQI